MNIEVKKSKKPIKYEEAINFMESKIHKVNENTANELIWTLEHNEIYTAGTSFKENEILDKSIKIIKTNRGGKITYHGPCLLYTSPSPRDKSSSRMPSSA